MRKQVLFSAMLTLGMMGGLTAYPVPAMALVAQQTIKVSGQVVDQEESPNGARPSPAWAAGSTSTTTTRP